MIIHLQQYLEDFLSDSCVFCWWLYFSHLIFKVGEVIIVISHYVKMSNNNKAYRILG